MTSSDLYGDGNGVFGKRGFSFIVMKTSTITALVSFALLLAMAAHAQGKKDEKADSTKMTGPGTSATFSSSMTISVGTKSSSDGSFGSHLEPILKTVNASDDQRKSITAIVDDFKVRIVPLKKRHDELRDQFLKSLTSGETGETVMATQSDFIRAQNDLNAQYLALRLKVQQVLSPEQNEKFKEYRLKQGWKSK